MTYYTLPMVSSTINPSDIKIKFNNNSNQYINKTLSKYLNQVKEQIDKHSEEWDNIKKYTNPYEYIHTCYPNSKHPISKVKPLSRAFFKFIEIANVFDIFTQYNSPIRSFHLAEGPGGFIEAIQSMRKNSEDTYYGMTLIDKSNNNVPGWGKSDEFLSRHSNIIIEEGEDGTGNLYNPDNFNYCLQNYGNSIDIITGDGGFDFSIDFNKQEELAFKLIFSQVAYAIGMQKLNGTFILKIFETVMKSSVDIIYMLSSFYKTVHIIKPNTSRYANSEKYIVCMGFRYSNTKQISKKFKNILTVLNNTEINNISSILDMPINQLFISGLEDVNAILGQQQMENILTTMRFIENKERKGERLNYLTTKNIEKCINWCIKYNIPHYKTTNSGNIFLDNKKHNYRKT
uniref:Ribosomal RNA methyltransferase FtsJ domain-containing protein n=1 Tax=viral metagenome TaxID=1070528 RepID=A0A6C0C455_9ZZZZ